MVKDICFLNVKHKLQNNKHKFFSPNSLEFTLQYIMY